MKQNYPGTDIRMVSLSELPPERQERLLQALLERDEEPIPFPSYEPIDAESFSFGRLQREHKLWADYNFPDRVPHMPLLGMVEELGEAEEDDELDTQIDARCDLLVFLVDYCNQTGLDLEEAVNAVDETLDKSAPVKSSLYHVGKISHAHLKREQNIRKNEDHDANIRLYAGCLVWSVMFWFEQHDLDFKKAMSDVWGTVRQRDWRKKVHG